MVLAFKVCNKAVAGRERSVQLSGERRDVRWQGLAGIAFTSASGVLSGGQFRESVYKAQVQRPVIVGVCLILCSRVSVKWFAQLPISDGYPGSQTDCFITARFIRLHLITGPR